MLTCCTGLTLGETVLGDPVKVSSRTSLKHQSPKDSIDEQDIIKTAFDAGINMFDTAEGYAAGKSEEEMCVTVPAYF